MDPSQLVSAVQQRRLRLSSLAELRAAFGPNGSVEMHLKTAAAAAAPTQLIVVAVDGTLVDLTDFVALHPGGATTLMQMRGRDVTASFRKMNHSENAAKIAQSYRCGEIGGETATPSVPAAIAVPVSEAVAPPVAAAVLEDTVTRAIAQRDRTVQAMEERIRARSATTRSKSLV